MKNFLKLLDVSDIKLDLNLLNVLVLFFCTCICSSWEVQHVKIIFYERVGVLIVACSPFFNFISH